LIERITQMPLGQYGEQAVFGPLGLHQATFCPPPSIQGLCAATELIDGQALVGVVHDENARALGGMAGHAGLFATLDAVSRYAALWSSSAASGLPHAAKEAALRSETGSLDGNRGLGWVLHGDAYDVAGDLWPLSGAGHTGFTGTSIQFDRVTGIWAVLLTNRVHFGRAVNIGGLRRRFHNAVAAALLG
jgi:CubicO group peptidase (beta-lactamase class C family)